MSKEIFAGKGAELHGKIIAAIDSCGDELTVDQVYAVLLHTTAVIRASFDVVIADRVRAVASGQQPSSLSRGVFDTTGPA